VIRDFIGTGLSFPLELDADGTFSAVGGARKLEQAMWLILSTYPGERPMRPEFGCRLRDFVFRGATAENAGAVSREVRDALTMWEPRAEVVDVEVYPDVDDHGLLYVDVTYTVRATNDRRNLVFPFYTIPAERD
jgi:uncharacterized protein